MNYIRIQLNKNSYDKRNELRVLQIAKWHNLTPKIWMPDYRVSTSDIERTVEKIQSTKNEDLFIMIAEDKQDQMQGFIWAYKQGKPQDSIMISSLYVTEAYRGQGIATKLKVLLEEWCRLEDVKIIQTMTHYNNHNMISLNKKLGYTPGMVHMTKTL